MPTPPTLRPERTAIARKVPSLPAQAVVESVVPEFNITTLLDFGCGRGTDVSFFIEQGLQAEGYDPHYAPGRPPRGRFGYELVTSFYVLNVLSTEAEREVMIRTAIEFARLRGHLVLAARSASEIESEARKGGWEPYGDGYITGNKATFQHGLTDDELQGLARKAGLVRVPFEFGLSSRTVIGLFQRSFVR
jgi:DNA phosphorothioation-associated putative methyltransferase